MVSMARTYGSRVGIAGLPHSVFVSLRWRMQLCRSTSAMIALFPPNSTLMAALPAFVSVVMKRPASLFQHLNRTYVLTSTGLQVRYKHNYDIECNSSIARHQNICQGHLFHKPVLEVCSRGICPEFVNLPGAWYSRKVR